MMRLQNQRSQRRRQGQRVECRDHRCNGDRHGKLPEELARDAGQEGGGDEYRAQHERDGHQRVPDLAALRLLRRAAAA
jgi:hypothetical protein